MKTKMVHGPCQHVHTYVVLLFANFHSYSAARGRKTEALRVLYANDPSIEIVEIADIVHGQFQDALLGVDAVIHIASPLPGRTDPQNMLNVCTLKLVIPLQIANRFFTDCHRGFFERLTASRKIRSQEVCYYKLDSYCIWRSHRERHSVRT